MKISAIILTKDEEENMRECLNSLRWCNEVVIIDDGSNDNTLKIASGFVARILNHPLKKDFSQQRNYGLLKAKNEWVLFIDADERVSEALASEILKIKDSTPNVNNGFYIKRRDFMWGRELKHGEVGNIKLLRLAKKESGKWIGKVHEVWKIKGIVGELNQPINHYAHASISNFLEKINHYTDIRAKELYEKNVKSFWWSIIIYPTGKLFLNYFFKLGFLDGIEGLIFSLMMSLHSFFVRAKLWFLWQRVK